MLRNTVGWAALCCLVGSCWASRVVVLPIDSRPVTGQFPQMIARIANVEVTLPPESILGRYTTPANPSAISGWLLRQSYGDVIAAVISADMLAYGGLIESRLPNIPSETAIDNLNTLRSLRAAKPDLPIYVYSALMRTAPTATQDSRTWRLQMARYAELQDKYARTGEQHIKEKLRSLRTEIPDRDFERYWAARRRNLEVHKALIRMVKEGVITYLIIGADDSQEYGPHVGETRELRAYVAEREIGGLVYICDGLDQNANVLLSRALLRYYDYLPRVAFVPSDARALDKPANYESQPLRVTIRDQIIASGARPTDDVSKADYVLYVNTKGVGDAEFEAFASALINALNSGAPVALADINFDATGSGDSRLTTLIWSQQRLQDLTSFAGWNTASNTLGTALPHANVYLLAKRISENALRRETAQREFLFHRLVNDYGYCKIIRPAAFNIVEGLPNGSKEESSGTALEFLQDWVAQNAAILIEKYFQNYFRGHTFRAGDTVYTLSSISKVKVSLPWPRAFEARIEFEIGVAPASLGTRCICASCFNSELNQDVRQAFYLHN